MNWVEHWRALSARIEGLMEAGHFIASAFKVNSSDTFAVVGSSLIPELKAITEELKEFQANYAAELPPGADSALKTFLERGWGEGLHNRNSAVNIQVLAPLAAFRSQFDYLIRDSEIEIRNLTELAFEHLRRLIVVDPDVKKKWDEAYQNHETSCERLGAVHLLNHGIWAFKVIASGGATDLVFSDPLHGRLDTIKRTARALVLTEWKLVKKANQLEAKAQEARSQTTSYSSGVLGGTELKGTRYIVLVTNTDLPSPEDVIVGKVTYRHIVLPIQPESPSVAARKQSQGKA